MKKFGNHLKRASRDPHGDFAVKLSFDDGASGRVDLGALFDHPKGLSAEILKGGMFDKFFVEAGALAWPNGFELCPDTLRHLMTEQKKQLGMAA